MINYTEAEMLRVIDVGSACADFVDKLTDSMAKAEDNRHAEALFLSAVESIVDGVFYHLGDYDANDDLERHKFATATFKALLDSRTMQLKELEENDGNNTENADGPLC